MRPHPRPTRRLLQLAALLHAPLDRAPVPIGERQPDVAQPALDLAAVRSVPRAENSAAGTPAQPIERDSINSKS